MTKANDQGGETVPTKPRPQLHELTSLEERLGLLLIVRVALVLIVAGAAVFIPDQLHAHLGQVGPISLTYLVIAASAEAYRRTRSRFQYGVHRLVMPLDAVYLTLACVPSGGARSPFVVLFAVQLIAVTLLASQRTGLRMALWDTLLLVVIPAASLSQGIGTMLGVADVVVPSASSTVVSITGIWAVGLCTALFSSVSERELRRSKSEMAALADMAAAVETATEEEDILSLFLAAVVGSFPVRRGALWYLREGRPVGLHLEERGAEVTAVPVPPLAKSDRIAIMAWEDRQPHLLRRLDPEDDPVAFGLLPDATNVIVLPLHADGDLSGLVLLEHGGHPLNARIQRRTLVMLVQFAAHAALALRTARLLTERSRLAAMDGLTSLANRRELDRVLDRESKRALRSQEPLSLVVLDVDHFKMINDTRGHLGGDEVLKAIAAALRDSVRDMDLAARYGGEEFAVVLPRCGTPNAVGVVERIVRTIRARSDLEGVTLSAGVATLPVHATDALSLVGAADEALYESKHNGRDRYSISHRDPGDSGISSSGGSPALGRIVI